MLKVEKRYDGTLVAVQEFVYPHITFVLTQNRIAFQIGAQFCILEPLEPYYHKRLATVRLLIQMGKIRTINDLAEHTSGRLKWVRSQRNWLK